MTRIFSPEKTAKQSVSITQAERAAASRARAGTPASVRTAVAAAVALVLLVPALPNPAAEDPEPRPAARYALTIHGGPEAQALFGSAVDPEPVPGHALVHEQRSVEIGSGRGTLTLQGFPRYLDAGALTATLSGGQVLSQRFDAEPLRGDTLLHRSLGRQVTVEQDLGGETRTLTGELLTTELPLSLRLDDGSVISLNDYSRIRMPPPATPYSAVPQLRLGVESDRPGRQALGLIYATSGLAWRPEYVARLHPGDDCRLDFSAYARIINRSGHGFADARVKLVAGGPGPGLPTALAPDSPEQPADNTGTGAYSYRVTTPLDLPDGSSQQVSLLPAQHGLPCQRELLYAASQASGGMQRVPQTRPAHHDASPAVTRQVVLQLENDSALPPGPIRVLAEDSRDGTIQLLGEQALPAHQPGQRLGVAIGIATGIAAQRRMLDLVIDPDELGLTETIRIHLDNGTGQVVPVRVREHLWRWREWQVTKASHEYERLDGNRIDFHVAIPGNGSATIDYAVRYRWNRDFR